MATLEKENSAETVSGETVVEPMTNLAIADPNDSKNAQSTNKQSSTLFGDHTRAESAANQINHSDTSPPIDTLKGEPLACVFVASLNAIKSDDQLTESVTRHFEQYGGLIDVKVQRDWQGRPYAFVQFHDAEDAKNALKYSNNQMLDSRHIRVEQARVNRTLFLAKFDKDMTKEAFREMVEYYGPVEEVSLLHNFQTGKSRGCGFVKYKFRDDAIKAFPGLRNENRIVVQWAANLEKDPQNTDKTSIFVGRLNSELVSQEALHDHFSTFGEIEEVNLVLALPPRPSFAFIKYSTEASALAAIESENGKEWLSRFIRVKIKEINADHERRRTSSTESTDTLYHNYTSAYNQGQPMPYAVYPYQQYPYGKPPPLQPYYYDYSDNMLHAPGQYMMYQGQPQPQYPYPPYPQTSYQFNPYNPYPVYQSQFFSPDCTQPQNEGDEELQVQLSEEGPAEETG